MWGSEEDQAPIQRPDRPVGITFLTLLDGLVAGIFPALSTASAVMRGAGQAGDQVSLLGLCISVGLSIAIITAAIGTYKGSDPARLALIFLIVIHSGLQIFQALSFSIAGVPNPGPAASYLGRSLATIALMVLNSWYFLRPATIAFYRRSLVTPQN